MKKLSIMLLLVSLFSATLLNAGYEQDRKVLTSAKILQDALKAPKTGITKNLLHNAKAIAVFPNTQKAAFFIGGRRGKGVLCIKNVDGSWSQPIFVDLQGLSAGLQFGFKASDLIVIFKTERSLDNLSEGKITIGLNGGAVAIAKGVGGGVETDKNLAGDLYNSQKSSGLFVGLSIAGATIIINDEDNFDYYDRLVYIDDILANDITKEKSETKKLKKALSSF
jgi:lipid-binding SYLF domain-containing protein